jgi:phage terminase large subunit-like protein
LFRSPDGVASKAPGEAAIRQARAAGLILDDWQEHVLRESLGVRKDGKWAAFSVGLVVPRQNGKGAVLEALALAALFQFDVELTVWTAHQMKTAKEGFRRLMAHIKGTPDLDRQVAKYKMGNDDRGIELRDGRRIQFIARGTGGSGRGFTGDLIIFDEAYELDSDTISDVLPTLIAVPNPQVWYTSSAPMATSEQLHAVRARAISGQDKRLAFFEWSVDKDVDPYRSPESWAKANPALGTRVTLESIEAQWNEFNADVDPSKFAREVLGVPDTPLDQSSVIPPALWAALEDEDSRIDSCRSWAVAVSPIDPNDPDGAQWAAIGVAGRRSDGHLHVEFREHNIGTSWLIQRCKAAYDVLRIPVRIHKSGPEGQLIARLREAGVPVVEVSSTDVAQSTGALIAAAKAWLEPGADGDEREFIFHPPQPSLDKAIKGAVLKMQTDGAAIWSQRSSAIEITPLMAVTVALGGVSEPQKRSKMMRTRASVRAGI